MSTTRNDDKDFGRGAGGFWVTCVDDDFVVVVVARIVVWQRNGDELWTDGIMSL